MHFSFGNMTLYINNSADNLAAADLVLQDDELSAIWETSDRVLRDLES